MPDFLQHPAILTLPLLAGADPAAMERDLAEWTAQRPLALVLPCHVRDLHSDAMRRILETLSSTPWISRAVIGIDGAGEDSLHLPPLPPQITVIRRSGPAGKGANLRDCLAAAMEGTPFAIAMHDCDVRDYSREFLARLCWPVLHPEAGLHASKGYYARTAAMLHGRVFRLFLQPLLMACAALLPPHPWLRFLCALRYPLSGELCVRTPLLSQLELPGGWDVELALLSGLWKSQAPICQAELCPAYDHKHQEPAALVEMASVIARRLLLTLAEQSLLTGDKWPAELVARAGAFAAEAVQHSALIAGINGMGYTRAAEAELSHAMMLALTDDRSAAGTAIAPPASPPPARPPGGHA